MRLLASVYPHMSGEVSGFSKRLLTQTARVWLFTSVDPHMSGQVARFSKWLFTQTTLVWFFTFVDLHNMFGQFARLSKRSPTQITLIRLLSVVAHHMLSNGCIEQMTYHTNRTGEAAHCCGYVVEWPANSNDQASHQCCVPTLTNRLPDFDVNFKSQSLLPSWCMSHKCWSEESLYVLLLYHHPDSSMMSCCLKWYNDRFLTLEWQCNKNDQFHLMHQWSLR